jgi:hypothetical protein
VAAAVLDRVDALNTQHLAAPSTVPAAAPSALVAAPPTAPTVAAPSTSHRLALGLGLCLGLATTASPATTTHCRRAHE